MTMQTQSHRTFCPHCHTEAEYQVLRRHVEIDFRGKKYDSEEEVALCMNCNAEFDMLHLMDPLTRVFEEYRLEHGYPTPDQIRSVRKGMRLTEEAFGSIFLGVSGKTIRLYERGALPKEEHVKKLADLIRITKPVIFEPFVTEMLRLLVDKQPVKAQTGLFEPLCETKTRSRNRTKQDSSELALAA